MIQQPHPGEIYLLLSFGFEVRFYEHEDTCYSLSRRSLIHRRILVFILFAEGVAGAPNRMNQALPKWGVDFRT
jgi:hypothetical protein